MGNVKDETLILMGGLSANAVKTPANGGGFFVRQLQNNNEIIQNPNCVCVDVDSYSN